MPAIALALSRVDESAAAAARRRRCVRGRDFAASGPRLEHRFFGLSAPRAPPHPIRCAASSIEFYSRWPPPPTNPPPSRSPPYAARSPSRPPRRRRGDWKSMASRRSSRPFKRRRRCASSSSSRRTRSRCGCDCASASSARRSAKTKRLSSPRSRCHALTNRGANRRDDGGGD